MHGLVVRDDGNTAVCPMQVEAGFATKAERRLASRLNALREKFQETQPPPEESPEAATAGEEPRQDPQLPNPGPTPFAAAGLQETVSRQEAPPGKELPQQQWYYKDPVGNIQVQTARLFLHCSGTTAFSHRD